MDSENDLKYLLKTINVNKARPYINTNAFIIILLFYLYFAFRIYKAYSWTITLILLLMWDLDIYRPFFFSSNSTLEKLVICDPINISSWFMYFSKTLFVNFDKLARYCLSTILYIPFKNHQDMIHKKPELYSEIL